MERRSFSAVDTLEVARELERWFGSAGSDVRAAEIALAQSVIPNLFGYHIVQLGNHVSDRFLAATRIAHGVTVAGDAASESEAGVLAHCDALPFLANSIDVMLIPHVLEFAADPHDVLREAERVLIGEGRLVLIGFNPWSLCGVWRIFSRWRRRPPWSGAFLSLGRTKDWLKLLGFEIEYVKKTSYRPPIKRDRFRRKLQFMEDLGAYCWPILGNVYFVVAKKRVATATPLHARWKTRRRVIAGGVAEPTTRDSNSSGAGASVS